MKERSPVHLSTEVAADGRLFPGRRGFWENEVGLGLIAFGCALFLLFGILMPDWFARTSWSSGSRNSSTEIFDSPAGYVGLVSLCGLIAFVALAVSAWRRR